MDIEIAPELPAAAVPEMSRASAVAVALGAPAAGGCFSARQRFHGQRLMRPTYRMMLEVCLQSWSRTPKATVYGN